MTWSLISDSWYENLVLIHMRRRNDLESIFHRDVASRKVDKELGDKVRGDLLRSLMKVRILGINL